MKTLPTVGLACVVVSLCACASLPKATITYYPAKTSMSVTVLRTMNCNAQDQFAEALAVTPSVVQAANPSIPHPIDVSRLSGFMSDTDLTVDLYDDGRLKSVNGGTTGQGETALTTAFTLIGAVVLAMDGSNDHDICARIKLESPDGKGLSLTYAGEVDLDKATESPINLVPESVVKDKVLLTKLGTITATAGPTDCKTTLGQDAPALPPRADTPVTYADATEYTPSSNQYTGKRLALDLVDPARTMVTVCMQSPMQGDARLLIWSGVVEVAQTGKPYRVYFAKPAPFGNTYLSLDLSGSGALTSIQYKRGSGTGSALKVLSTAANAKETALEDSTAKDKAWLERQATNQKMVACKLDRTKC